MLALCGAAILLWPASPAAGLPVGPALPAQSFTSCEEAAAAGFTDMALGEPGYSSVLDQDGDGIACESGDLAPVAPPTSEPAPAPEVLGATAESAPADEELAETGASTWILVLIAMALLAAGRHVITIADDHLGWRAGRHRSGVRYTVQPVRRRR